MKLTVFLFVLAFVVLISAKPNSSNSTDHQGDSLGRIVGGKLATKPYAYQVSVQAPVEYGRNGEVSVWGHTCGGSIISPRHILTAAHCVVTDDGKLESPKHLSARAGSHDYGYDGTRYYAAKVMHHKSYYNEGQPNSVYDIAIMTVVGTITFIPKQVESIKYSEEETGGGVSCVITGWGSTTGYSNAAVSEYLKELRMTTLSKKDCDEYWHGITDYQLCALARKGEGACAGDSGGPLVDISTQKLIGVAQSVDGNCADGVPDLFVRVSAFYQWIQENTRMTGMVFPQRHSRR